MARNAERTRKRLLAAAERVVEKRGIAAAGVNAIAAESGVDKVLIYRYFGGARELLAALGRERGLWPESASHLDATAPSAAVVAALRDLADAFERSAMLRRAAGAEAAGDEALGGTVAAAREERSAALVAALRERHVLPSHLDLPALVALLSAAITYLSLLRGEERAFCGLDLGDPGDWRRIEKLAAAVARALLDAPEI